MNRLKDLLEGDELKVPRGELFSVIQDVIGMADDFRSRAEPSLVDNQLCPPRMLLAILVYCYLRGIYGSAQIEEVLKDDAELKGFAGCRPDFALLRKFRRANRELVQQTLRHVRWFLWAKYRSLAQDQKQGSTPAGPRRISALIASESAETLSRAVFVDHMMMD
jgi:hypothetical protein